MAVETLAERVRDFGWAELASILELPEHEIDPALAAYWQRHLSDGEVEMFAGHVSLWTTQRELVRIVCECVRLYVKHVTLVRVLNTIARCADEDVSFEEKSKAGWEASTYAVAGSDEGVVVGHAADVTNDWDSEAIESANRAIRHVLKHVDAARVRDIFARLVPIPTLARFVTESQYWD